MIDSAPRPLPQRRLEKIVHGLRERMSGSLQKTTAEIAVMQSEIQSHQDALLASEQELASDNAVRLDESTTQWDEALHSCWDAQEMRAFSAVFATVDNERRLKREAKVLADDATAEAKKRIGEIEKRFLQAKDVPIKQLTAFRAKNSGLLEQLAGLENKVDSALASRSLSVPKHDVEVLPVDELEDSKAALEQLKSAIANCQTHTDRLANNKLAKFFESAGWWALCALTFVVVAAILAVTQSMELLFAILSGAGASVAVLVLGFVGIRPWLKRSAAAEYPKLKSYAQLARTLSTKAEQLAVAENDAELKRLAGKRDERFEQAKSWRDQQIVELTQKLEKSIANLREQARVQKLSARTQLSEGIETITTQFESQLAGEDASYQSSVAALKTECENQCDALRKTIDGMNRGGALRMQIATQKAVQVISRSRRWCNGYFPKWDSLGDNGSWPDELSEPVLPLGSLMVESLLPDTAKLDIGGAQLSAPVLFSPLVDEYLTITGDPNHPTIKNLVRNLVMRALTTMPAGKTQLCVIDPPGLGRDFGWLMHLSDFDPQLVSHRVWTQPGHIAKQIGLLAMAAEDFIQQSLRNQYENIVQYNREAGALSEPYRILVWSSLPSSLEDQSWKGLQSLLDTGARCGIIPVLVIDPNISWPTAEQKEIVMRRGLHLKLSEDGKSLIANAQSLKELPIQPAESPTDERAQGIVQEVGRRALLSNRVEVPLDRMVPPVEDRWTGDSSNFLEIPIGQSGVGRTHSLKLGVGTAQHAIIAGKTGSGKSSLLHAMITSALLKYSPESLRVVLLDFKKGVEFQVYSDAEIPHADIIGIESHREFGLSALEYVDSCMQRRGEAFRGAGVQDIASWNAMHPDSPIPRTLVVVDEFQELFVEDDKLSGQASLILDRIVRQGRSFGVHAVLSSQTLAGSYSLPRTTLGQMAVRIALQCDASDAQIIFAEDNPAAARLKHPGQAVYNDAGGRIEGNQPMQIGWLPKNKQVEWFGELPHGYRNADPSTNRLGRTVVYDGNRAATWNDENARLSIEQSQKEINPDATWCIAGESVAISPAVAFPLTRQAGRNVLIVGADDPQATAVLHVVNASVVKSAHASSQVASIYMVQGAKPTDARALALPNQLKALDCELKVADQRGCDAMLSEVHALLQERMNDESGEVALHPVLLNLVQLGRLRSLRKDDDFGMGSFGESELTPERQLEEILRDGPSYGVHTLTWVEGYSTLNRWLARSALREIEIRILMQMSGNDSTNLIDSIAASRLGDHVMLLFDEATGQEQKFRPFAVDTLNSLEGWSK